MKYLKLLDIEVYEDKGEIYCDIKFGTRGMNNDPKDGGIFDNVIVKNVFKVTQGTEPIDYLNIAINATTDVIRESFS